MKRIEDRGSRIEDRKRRLLLLFAILYPLSSILHPQAVAQIPWPDGAVGHYRVEVASTRPTNDTAQVCAVRFFSGGALARDSQNVRVTDSKGTALPIQIIYTHPLNASIVLFPIQAGEEKYHLFFGGSVVSGAAAGNFDRGLFYETRARPDGDSSTWDSIRKLWAAATNSLGVIVLEDSQTRGNPLDESDNQFMSRTWGAWRTPREDVYKIGLYARDQGFFSVNGQPVASTVPDPTLKTQPITDVLLSRGIQAMEILQARISGSGVTALSWLVPWPEYYGGNLSARPVTAPWHPPVVTGLARDYAVRDQPSYACFNDFETDMLLAADQPIVMVRFHNRTGGKIDGVAYQWDFGDGTTSTEANPLHVYVKPGRYAVTLTAGGTSKFQKIVLATSFSAIPSQKVAMYNSQNPFAAQEMIRLVTPTLDRYEPGTLWTLIALAEQIPDRKIRAETILKLGPLYLTKSGANMPTQVEIPARQKLATAKGDLGQWDAAVAELQQMDPKLEKQRSLRSKLRLEIARLNQRGNRYPQAIQVYNQLITDKGGDDPKLERAAQIGLGDTYLQQGDLGSARKAYEQAVLVEVGDGRTERERAIRRGSLYTTLRQTVTELVKLGFDASGDAFNVSVDKARASFDGLVFEFPDARLNPDVLYLNASLLLTTGEIEACLAELKTLAKAEASGRYTLRSMLIESRAGFRNKDYDKSNSLLEALLKTTKDEDLVKEATALQTLVKDAIKSRAQFTDATKRYWPSNLFPEPSFETREIEAGKPLPFELEWSTPTEPAKATEIKVNLESGFGSEGKRCLRLELLKPVAAPCYVTIRFPTAIGDRLFARCNVLCTDADFRFAELRRTTTQGDAVYSIIGAAILGAQQYGQVEPIASAEPWRTLSWRSGIATAGDPKGYINLLMSALPGRTIIPAGTRIYLDDIECYLAP